MKPVRCNRPVPSFPDSKLRPDPTLQELIVHIAATMIAGVIILILAVVAWRGQHHSVSSEQYSAAKRGVLDLVQVFEEDFSNMGAGRTNATLKNPAGYGDLIKARDQHTTDTWLEISELMNADKMIDG